MQRMKDSVLRVPISKGSLLWIQGLLSIITGCAIGAAMQKPGLWSGVALALAIQAFCAWWLLSFRLALRGEVLEYRSLFRGLRKIRLAEIESSVVQIGENAYRDKFRPPIRLQIKPKRGVSQRPFDINLKVFEARRLNELLEILGNG